MNSISVRRVRRLSIPLLVLWCVLAMFGCNRGSTSTIAGKYVDEKKSQDFTELKTDGTFLIQQENQSANGKYSIDGKRLILTMSSGEVVEGKIDGKTIIDNGGSRLTKQ